MDSTSLTAITFHGYSKAIIKRNNQPVTVASVVSFEGLSKTTFFVLMVLFSFIKGVFQLVSILYKRPVSIDKRNWPCAL
jgi:hypothetical protein